jgi:cytochrome c-type biogenesis protein CcmH
MKTKIIFLLAFYFLFTAAMVAPSARVSAQQPTPSDDDVNAIARQLFCPVCENTPLDVCPTQACHDWRELIRQMLAEGKTPDQIKQYFVDHYGARVLSEPPRTGLNWLVYVVPPVAFLVGVYLLFRAFRIWRRPEEVSVKQADPGSNHVSDDGYVTRLEEELRKRK